MAENQDDRSSEDLSDEISQYRLEDFRQKGMVAQSRELTGLLVLLATAVTVYAMSPNMGAQVAEYMREVFKADAAAKLNFTAPGALETTLLKALKLMAAIGLPVCLAGFFFGVVGSFAQVGSIFSTEPLTPDFEKINPLKGIQRFVSMKGATEGLRLIAKATIIVAVAYAILKSEILKSPGYILQDPASVAMAFSSTSKVVFLPLLGILLVFAGIDFGFQRWEYGKQLRLTKQEAKQEHKEREGDPQIKARIRSVQREMARRRMMQAVKKADVIVTNPTHIAIAIVYEKSNMMAPKVVAKGADFLAQRIKKVAAEAGVPLVENVPLARTLFKAVKVGQFIPRNLYQAVAEVLAYVYKLKGHRL